MKKPIISLILYVKSIVDKYIIKKSKNQISEIENNVKIIYDQIYKIEKYFNKDVIIYSLLRSESMNKLVGGPINSLHLTGKAVDFTIKGLSPNEIAFGLLELISNEEIIPGYIGIYEKFVYYDIRGKVNVFGKNINSQIFKRYQKINEVLFSKDIP